ncbi:MAG: hypothetical protein EPN50_04740 [Chloroflexota bacterium]|nr:MAG: hypothetical protein EPN50_04740 [Chloroflexota bacterium]
MARTHAYAIYVGGRRVPDSLTASRDQALREARALRSTYASEPARARPTVSVRVIALRPPATADRSPRRRDAYAIYASGRRVPHSLTASRDQAVREAAALRSTYGDEPRRARPTIRVRRIHV